MNLPPLDWRRPCRYDRSDLKPNYFYGTCFACNKDFDRSQFSIKTNDQADFCDVCLRKWREEDKKNRIGELPFVWMPIFVFGVILIVLGISSLYN